MNINKSKIQFETYSQLSWHTVFPAIYTVNINKSKIQFETYSQHAMMAYHLTFLVNINKSKIQFETYSQLEQKEPGAAKE